jgi:hypothetical protein
VGVLRNKKPFFTDLTPEYIFYQKPLRLTEKVVLLDKPGKPAYQTVPAEAYTIGKLDLCMKDNLK